MKANLVNIRVERVEKAIFLIRGENRSRPLCASQCIFADE